MLPFSKRKLYEQIITGAGLVLAFVKCYANWKTKHRYSSTLDLTLSLFTVGFIITGIVTGLFFLIHLIERKWKNQIVKEGRSHHWQIRPAADCGINLAPLFPMALLLGLLNYWTQTTHIYAVVTVLSQGFMFTSLAYLWKTGDSIDNSQNTLVTVTAISSVKVALVLWHLKLLGFAGSCLMAFCSQFFYLMLLCGLLQRCPKTFSIGEALMVSQAVIALIVACFLWIVARVLNLCGSAKMCHLGAVTTQLAFVLALGVSFLVLLMLLSESLHRPLPFYGLCGILAFFFIYPSWFWILKSEPVQWLFSITFSHSISRSLLAVHWLACVVLSLAIVAWANIRGIRITTTIRKYFHGVVILIFVPGIILDAEYLFLATVITITVFLGVECIRVLQVPPIGNAIQAAVKSFLDEKDVGTLILTHIYLLIGCAISLWIIPLDLKKNGFHISLASGILALAFGDTAASVGGTWFGKHKWPDTNKTIEGTTIAIAVQAIAAGIIFFLFSAKTSDPEFVVNCVYLLVATVLSCVLEGATKQIDNLVLPVYLYMILVVT